MQIKVLSIRKSASLLLAMVFLFVSMVGGAAVASGAVPVPECDPDLLIYEGFDYVTELGSGSLPANAIAGKNGGHGWNNAWSELGDTTFFRVFREEPLRYNNLVTTGKYLTGGGWYRSALRNVRPAVLPSQNGSEWWLSFVLRLDQIYRQNGIPQFAGVELMNNFRIGLVTDENNTAYWGMDSGSGYATKHLPPLDEANRVQQGQPVLLVVRVQNRDSGADVSMFINPDINDGFGTHEISASLPSVPNVNTFRFYPGAGANFGAIADIRFGKTFNSVTPRDQRQPLTRVRVYPVDGDSVSRFEGMSIYGSNAGHTPTEPMGTFAAPQEGKYAEAMISTEKRYRYLGISAPNDGTPLRISNLEFYIGSTVGRRLVGTPFGTRGLSGHEPDMAFDNDASTWYESDLANSPPTLYIGLDLGGDTQVAQPKFDPPGGRFSDSVTVSIESETDGASIYFTTDKSMPDSSNELHLYKGSITFTSGQAVELRAIAVKDGLQNSPMNVEGYGVDVPPPIVRGLSSYSLGSSLSDPFNGEAFPGAGCITSVANSAGFQHRVYRATQPGTATVVFYTHPWRGGPANQPWGDPDRLAREPYPALPEFVAEHVGRLVNNHDPYLTHEENRQGTQFSARNVFQTYHIDMLITQPSAGRATTIAQEVYLVEHLYNLLLKENPNARYLLHTQWPARNYGEHYTHTHRFTDYGNGDPNGIGRTINGEPIDLTSRMTRATNWDEATYNYMMVWERMVEELKKRFPAQEEKIVLVPTALVIKAYKDAVLNNEIPHRLQDYIDAAKAREPDYIHAASDAVVRQLIGLTIDGNELADLSHLANRNGISNYLLNLTMFTIMYRENPTDIVTWKPESMPEDEARAIRKLVWEVCRNARYSGLTNDNPL